MRLIRAIVCALVTVLSVASARAENTVRWATILQPSGLDPHAFGNQQTIAALLQVFEPLVNTDWRMSVEPSLALRWDLEHFLFTRARSRS
jgi:ABC-type transport system substrate-binding protein